MTTINYHVIEAPKSAFFNKNKFTLRFRLNTTGCSISL